MERSVWLARTDAVLRRQAQRLDDEITARLDGDGAGIVGGVGLDMPGSRDAYARVQDALVERDLAELRTIMQALTRIAAGDYGRCTVCGAAIDLARLAAQPAAARCEDCESQAELRLRAMPWRHANLPA